MQWYNSKTGELQSTPPWDASYVHPDVIAEIYADWTQVADDFTPAQPAKTAEQKIAELDADYEPQLTAITQAYLTAITAGDTTTASARQADYAVLKTEYANKRGEITNG